GQSSLFGDTIHATVMEPNLPIVAPWPRAQMLKEERELMGFYVTGHPLEAFAAEARAFATAQLGRVDELNLPDAEERTNGTQDRQNGFGGPRGPQHRFCGIITEVQHRTSKTGKPMAFATI